MNEMMAKKSKIDQIMEISGHLTYIQASYVNGRIVGSASLMGTTRKLTFDFAPMSEFSKSEMAFLEIKRLYLDYLKDEEGKSRLQLEVLSDVDRRPQNDFNCLDTYGIFLA